LAAGEQVAHRRTDPVIESCRVRPRTLAREHDEAVAYAHEGADGTLESDGDVDLVEAGGAQSLAGVLEGQPPNGFEQRLPFWEVAVDRRTGHARRCCDVIHARLFTLTSQRSRGRVDYRGGDAFTKRWSGNVL